MNQYSWNDCPAIVRLQVEQFVGEVQAHLREQLIGVYLHGSLAMGCFNPGRSDLDLLVITRQAMRVEIKRAIIEDLLRLSGQPGPIEISFLRQEDMIPWQHPTPYDLHYSEMWRDTYARDLATGAWQTWDDSPRRDPDLAAHITIMAHRGVCLWGAAIAEVFPAVPRLDYLDSIMGDVLEGLDQITGNPIYAILNACRTYAYLQEGYIYSKSEGGLWALDNLPESWHDLIKDALAAYGSEPGAYPMEGGRLEEFANYMRNTLLQQIRLV